MKFQKGDVVDWDVLGAGGPKGTPLGTIRGTVVGPINMDQEWQELSIKPHDWDKAGDVLCRDMTYSEIRSLERDGYIPNIQVDDVKLVTALVICPICKGKLSPREIMSSPELPLYHTHQSDPMDPEGSQRKVVVLSQANYYKIADELVERRRQQG